MPVTVTAALSVKSAAVICEKDNYSATPQKHQISGNYGNGHTRDCDMHANCANHAQYTVQSCLRLQQHRRGKR